MSKKSFNSPKQYLRHQLVPPGVWAVCQESKWRTDSSGVSHTHPDDWHDILQVTTPCELLKKCSHFSKYFPFSKGNKLKKLYEVILTLWTLRSGRGKKCTWGKKITEPKRWWIPSVRWKKKDLNNPKEVHTKHKIKTFLDTKRTGTFCWNKKTHQNACQKKEESKGGKADDVFLSPVLVRYVY